MSFAHRCWFLQQVVCTIDKHSCGPPPQGVCMMRRTITESVTVDITLVRTYVPVAHCLLQTLVPIALVSAAPTGKHALLAACTTLFCIHQYVLHRDSVFVVDTSSIACEALALTVLLSLVDVGQHELLLDTIAMVWAFAGSAYKIALPPPHSHPHARVAAGFTYIVLALIISTQAIRSTGPVLNAYMATSRACIYSLFCLVDAYVVCVAASRGPASVHRTRLTFFLHGSAMCTHTAHMLAIVTFILFIAQVFALFTVRRRGGAKKTDDPSLDSAEACSSTPALAMRDDGRPVFRLLDAPPSSVPRPRPLLLSATVSPAPLTVQGLKLGRGLPAQDAVVTADGVEPQPETGEVRGGGVDYALEFQRALEQKKQEQNSKQQQSRAPPVPQESSL